MRVLRPRASPTFPSPAVGSLLKLVFTNLQAAYREGVEAKTVELVEERASLEAFLAQERSFHGSSLACHHSGCCETLEYQDDVEKTVKTRIGDVTLKRAYYHGPCGRSACPPESMGFMP